MVLKPTSDSLINMELWLPTQNWNGKFMGVGNGGFAGSIQGVNNEMPQALRLGYSTAGTDTGHQEPGESQPPLGERQVRLMGVDYVEAPGMSPDVGSGTFGEAQVAGEVSSEARGESAGTAARRCKAGEGILVAELVDLVPKRAHLLRKLELHARRPEVTAPVGMDHHQDAEAAVADHRAVFGCSHRW